MSKIDRNRGCVIRFHPKGMRVVMYYDAPGEYFDERGSPLNIEVAKAAGFDVERLARDRAKQDKLNEYKKRLDKEFQEQEDKLAQAMSENSDLEVRHVGGGQYMIYSQDGDEPITKFAMNRAEAETLIEALDGGEASPGDEDDGVSTEREAEAAGAQEPSATAAPSGGSGTEEPPES